MQRRIWELAKAQRHAGDDVAVVSMGHETREFWKEGIRLQHLQCYAPGPMRQVEYLVRSAAVVRRFASEARECVLHVHNQPEAILIAAAVRRPAVLSYDYFEFRQAFGIVAYRVIRAFLKRYAVLLPCSAYCQDASTRYWGIAASRTQILYNGVNPTQFSHVAERRCVPELADLAPSRLIALYVGRVNEQKGTDVLIRAAAMLRERNSRVAVVVVGPIGGFDTTRGGSDWPRRLADAGVTYLGAVTEGRLAEIYRAADLFVMPTRKLEMFGMAALEAQACGLPVVASRHGGLPEVVGEDSGVFVTPGDADELTAALQRLELDPPLRARLREGAIARARLFSWAIVNAKLKGAYRRALDSK